MSKKKGFKKFFIYILKDLTVVRLLSFKNSLFLIIAHSIKLLSGEQQKHQQSLCSEAGRPPLMVFTETPRRTCWWYLQKNVLLLSSETTVKTCSRYLHRNLSAFSHNKTATMHCHRLCWNTALHRICFELLQLDALWASKARHGHGNL